MITAKSPKDLAKVRAAEGLATKEDLSMLSDKEDVDVLFQDDYLSESEVSVNDCRGFFSHECEIGEAF